MLLARNVMTLTGWLTGDSPLTEAQDYMWSAQKVGQNFAESHSMIVRAVYM